MRILFLPLTLALLAAPSHGAPAHDESSRLHDLFHRAWEFSLKERPTFATAVGRHEYNDRLEEITPADLERQAKASRDFLDRKSTRLNSSHLVISYAVFCLKKKKPHPIT